MGLIALHPFHVFMLFLFFNILNFPLIVSTPFHPFFLPAFLPLDVLRDTLFKSNVVGRTGAGTADQLVEWIKAKNGVVAARDDALWQTAYKGRNTETVAKAVGKARKNGFFLGMEPNWMEVE